MKPDRRYLGPCFMSDNYRHPRSSSLIFPPNLRRQIRRLNRVSRSRAIFPDGRLLRNRKTINPELKGKPAHEQRRTIIVHGSIIGSSMNQNWIRSVRGHGRFARGHGESLIAIITVESSSVSWSTLVIHDSELSISLISGSCSSPSTTLPILRDVYFASVDVSLRLCSRMQSMFSLQLDFFRVSGKCRLRWGWDIEGRGPGFESRPASKYVFHGWCIFSGLKHCQFLLTHNTN